MKKKILATLLAGIIANLAILFLTGCNLILKPGGGNYGFGEYNSQYTEEEHVERILARTEEIFAREIAKGEIANCTVEIIYEFYSHSPRYFMVELEYAEEFEASYRNPNHSYRDSTSLERIPYMTKWKYFIGYIQNDKYWAGLAAYKDFVSARNPYDALGYGDYKKYYGGAQHAVEVDGKRLRIYGGSSSDTSIPAEFKEQEGQIYFLSSKEEKRLKNDNYRLNGLKY